MKRIEFHSHTSLSGDGSWAPLEMMRSAREIGQYAIALTDHVGASNVESVLEALALERDAARAWNDFHVLIAADVMAVLTASRSRTSQPSTLPVLSRVLAKLAQRLCSFTARRSLNLLNLEQIERP